MAYIVAASKNKHKIEEIEAITKKYGMDVIARDKAGVPDSLEIEEDGETFEENSLKKAKGILEACGQPTLHVLQGKTATTLKTMKSSCSCCRMFQRQKRQHSSSVLLHWPSRTDVSL